MLDIYERMDLHALLETIQANLANNIDSFYQKANSLIGTGKIHTLGYLKENLKGQIETYLKTIVENISNRIKNSSESYNVFIQPIINKIKKDITNYLEKAIKE